MRLKAAAIYSAIGQNRLKDLARAGAIKGFQDPESKRGDWIFDRFDLDAYRERQAGDLDKKALAVLRSF